MKKLLVMLLTIVMMATCFCGFAMAEEVALEVTIGGEMGEDGIKALKVLFEKFTTETGIKIELVEEGNDHESVMKTRMASNNVPDLFSTHGWCVLRYGDYCMDVTNEPWVANMDPGIKAVMTNSDGQVLGCPMTLWTYGIVYNEQIFADNGVDPAAMKTWDDLMAACEKLAAGGVTPIAVGSKGAPGPNGFMEMMNVFYAIEGAPYDGREALKDGSFDYTTNTELLTYLAQMYDNGWFNEDIFTADSETACKYLGTGDCAMMLWGGTNNIALLERYFPEGEYGFIPTPAASADSQMAFTIGEGTSFAIGKDTEHPEEAKKLLAFLSDPANLFEYATINGGLPGFTNVEMPDSVSYNKYIKAVELYGDNLTFTNFFDREWMPSGMWNAMGEAMGVLFSGEGAASRIVEAGQILQDAYNDLY